MEKDVYILNVVDLRTLGNPYVHDIIRNTLRESFFNHNKNYL